MGLHLLIHRSRSSDINNLHYATGTPTWSMYVTSLWYIPPIGWKVASLSINKPTLSLSCLYINHQRNILPKHVSNNREINYVPFSTSAKLYLEYSSLHRKTICLSPFTLCLFDPIIVNWRSSMTLKDRPRRKFMRDQNKNFFN